MRLVFALVFPVLTAAACDSCATPDDPTPTPTPTGKNVFVRGSAVRSCQAVFLAGGEEIPSVVFSDAVTGEFIPRAPRFALAFTVNGDESVDNVEVARFQFTKNGAPNPTLVEARCSDGAGAVVADALQIAD